MYIQRWIIATATYLFGGLEHLITAFSIFLILDYVTGLAATFYLKQVHSRTGFIGIAKKAILFIFIIIAHKIV